MIPLSIQKNSNLFVQGDDLNSSESRKFVSEEWQLKHLKTALEII
jgi:hypothetical protein